MIENFILTSYRSLEVLQKELERRGIRVVHHSQIESAANRIQRKREISHERN